MRELAYGEQAYPEWGTKFTEIETEGMNIGLELARLFMEQSVGEQAGHVPDEALESGGEVAENGKETKDATLETHAGEVAWEQPRTRLKDSRRDFFPQAKSLGVSVDETLSPSMAEKVSHLGTILRSFPQGESAAGKLLEMTLGRKRIERLTERIGGERVEERDSEVEAYRRLTLMEKLAGPLGVDPPTVGCVMSDGGRYQNTKQNADSKTHWHEFKAGFCAVLEGRADGLEAGEDAPDPLPEVPTFLLNLEQMETLTREVGRKAADVPEPDEEADDLCDDPIDLDELSGLEQLEELVSKAESPREEASEKNGLGVRKFKAGMWWPPSKTATPSASSWRPGPGTWDCSRRSSKPSWAMGVRGCGRSGTATSSPSILCRFWTSSTPSRISTRRRWRGDPQPKAGPCIGVGSPGSGKARWRKSSRNSPKGNRNWACRETARARPARATLCMAR